MLKSWFLFWAWIIGVFAILGLSLVAIEGQAATCSFSWLPNNESNLAGYKIHYGRESQDYTVVTDVGNPETVDGRVKATLPFCVEGSYYIAATAYDTEGNESELSNEVFWSGFILPRILSITER